MAKSKEKIMEIVFLLAACVSILAVALICVFLFANGIPAMKKIGFADFLLGTTWKPGNDIYGIFPMILGSIYVTVGAIIIGVPIGLLTAVFLAWYCPEKIYKVVKPAVELLAGIPSVVWFLWYGNDRASNPLQLWWNRKQYFSSFDSFRDYDSPNNYRCI